MSSFKTMCLQQSDSSNLPISFSPWWSTLAHACLLSQWERTLEVQQHTDSLQDTGDVSSRQTRGFYQESDIAQLLSFAEASEKRESEATLRKVLAFLQRWVNSDPGYHTRRVLFEVLLIERLNLRITMAYDFVTGTHLPLHAGKNKRTKYVTFTKVGLGGKMCIP